MKILAGNQFSFKSLESLLRSSCINQTGLVLKIFQMGGCELKGAVSRGFR
jgi:hypothetical protein